MSLPQTVIVDLREELKEGNRGVISRRLEKELVNNKNNDEQSILFLNKRDMPPSCFAGIAGLHQNVLTAVLL